LWTTKLQEAQIMKGTSVLDCDNCRTKIQKENVVGCGDCKMVFYCNDACFNADIHTKKNCNILQYDY
jgi:hypothetical protein